MSEITQAMINARPKPFVGMRCCWSSSKNEWLSIASIDETGHAYLGSGEYSYSNCEDCFLLPGEPDCPPDPANADWVAKPGDEFWHIEGGWRRWRTHGYTYQAGNIGDWAEFVEAVSPDGGLLRFTIKGLRKNALRIPRAEKAKPVPNLSPKVMLGLQGREWVVHCDGFQKGAMMINGTDILDRFKAYAPDDYLVAGEPGCPVDPKAKAPAPSMVCTFCGKRILGGERWRMMEDGGAMMCGACIDKPSKFTEAVDPNQSAHVSYGLDTTKWTDTLKAQVGGAVDALQMQHAPSHTHEAAFTPAQRTEALAAALTRVSLADPPMTRLADELDAADYCEFPEGKPGRRPGWLSEGWGQE